MKEEKRKRRRRKKKRGRDKPLKRRHGGRDNVPVPQLLRKRLSKKEEEITWEEEESCWRDRCVGGGGRNDVGEEGEGAGC